jgi:ribosomal protein S18 acetylase RimI-like enzyme
MEIANLDRATIRRATSKDRQEIMRLLQEAAYSHVHADWRLPGDWLGTPGFVVSDRPNSSRGRPSTGLSGFGRMEPEIMACLAVAADPYPAAWVRIAALRQMPFAQEVLAAMFDAVLPYLQETGVSELGWLAVESWPDEMLPMLGFRRANWITTFIKEDLDIPPVSSNGVRIRPVRPEDMAALAAVEAEAFDPLWRHSAEGLRLARGRAICFDVALVGERIAGFQYSTSNYYGSGAHLVRITVRPSFQGGGVGSALMQAAVEQYRRRGLKRVSLNTQLDNVVSHRLYEKFGFYRTGEQMPVWVMDIGRGLG